MWLLRLTNHVFVMIFSVNFPERPPKAASLLDLTQLHYLALFTLGDLY